MKFKPTVILLTVVVAMGLLLGTNAESQEEQIISTWIEGILYWDAIESTMGQMTNFSTMGDIAAGEFTGDIRNDVASIWEDEGLWYQDGVTLEWTRVTPSAPIRVTAGDVTGDGRDEIIGIWATGNVTADGIWYYDVATSAWTRMTSVVGATDIAAGDFTGDGKADVASIWPNDGLFYQDGVTLDWIEVDKLPPIRVTAGDITGDGRDEIIANWSNGLWYWDVAAEEYTQIPTISPPIGDLAAGDFTGDGKADVAAIYDSGLWWVDGASPTWRLARGTDPAVIGEGPWSLTAGDVKSSGVIANAGPDQVVSTNSTVFLDGQDSLPEGGTYSWAFLELPPGSDPVLSNPEVPTPTFVADEAGTYIVELTYTVGLISDTDTVTVTAE